MSELKHDERAFESLVNGMTGIESVFDELVTELNNVKSSVTSNLKGDGATGLASALDAKSQKLTDSKNNWQSVIENAYKLDGIITGMDQDIKTDIEGQGLPASGTARMTK